MDHRPYRGVPQPFGPAFDQLFESHRPSPRQRGTTSVYSDYRTAKRALDVAGSIVLIVLLTPLMILIAAFLRVSERGPVLFAQERVGKNGKRFKCLKFRTMVVDAEEFYSPIFHSAPTHDGNGSRRKSFGTILASPRSDVI